MLRWWADSPNVSVHECDYNPSLVKWCNTHLGFAEVRANQPAPPLPYVDEQFDLLYALRMLGDRFELISRFDPKADPETATRARMSHDAYLVRRL